MRLATVVLILFATTPALSSSSDPRPVLSVTGGAVRGSALTPSGAVFKGIPYAQPPIGDLRWREPVPVASWRGVRDATISGPPCAQNQHFTTQASESREDCLYVNVWTPEWPVKAPLLPVMVWIPGGGNFAGSSNFTSGDKLVRRGVVVVTLNYRLGLFGFFAHPELTRESPHHASGNQGILDQIAALRWVRDNITKFGGDPANVTIFGESAGSFNISALMTSPLSRGLFRRAIGESGAVVLLGSPLPLKQAEVRGLSLAQTWTSTGETSLHTLRGLSAAAILAKEPDFLEHPQPNVGLVVDGYVFPEAPATVFAAGREHRVDMLHGSLAHEWVPGVHPPADLHAAIQADSSAGTAKNLEALYQAAGDDPLYGTPAQQWVEDTGFRCPSVQQLIWHTTAGNRAFEFSFDRLPPGFDKNANAHHQEVQYVFGLGQGNFTRADYALSEAIQQYWTNFARTGDPTGDPNGTGDLPKWPRFNPDSKPYLEFTESGPVARQALRGDFCKLWMESERQKMAH